MEINQQLVQEHAAMLLTPQEVAVTLGYDVSQVMESMHDYDSQFYIAFTMGRAAAKLSLNRTLFKLMELGAPNAIKSIQEQL